MEVFWRHGYAATSTQMLVDALGLNRFSLYAEFGSKQQLYEAALAQYEDEVVTRNLATLLAPEADLATVAQFIDGFAAWAGQPGCEVGCLMCNAATERGHADLASQQAVGRYVKRLQQGFGACLLRAQTRQQISPEVDIDAEAALLATLMLGFFVQLRSGVPAAALHACARAAKAHLRGLAQPSASTA